MEIKTKNFNSATDPKLLCTCGHKDCDRRSVKQSILDSLQLIRDDIKRPITITSGGRCPNHPDEKHRTIPADHQKGFGIDIKVLNGTERAQMVIEAIDKGFDAIGVAKTFVHIGYRGSQHNIMWTY